MAKLCKKCNRSFVNNFTLSRHQEYNCHPNSGSEEEQQSIAYECTLCHKEFKDNSQLISHMRYSHPVKHKKKIDKDNFTCKRCGKNFNTYHSLQNHAKVHQQYRGILFSCPQSNCERKYQSKQATVKHLKEYHGVKDASQINIQKQSVKTTTANSNHVTKSTVPKQQQNSNTNVQRGCELPKSYTVPQGMDKERWCPYCNRQYASNYSLNRHLEFNCFGPNREPGQGLEVQKCRICKKVFDSASNLSRHLKILHKIKQNDFQQNNNNNVKNGSDKRNEFKCKFCDKVFSFKNNRVRHEKSVHQAQKEVVTYKYKCKFCGKGFHSQDNLNEHKMKHTDKNPEHRCVIKGCEKLYFNSSSMYRHIRINHKSVNFEKLMKTVEKHFVLGHKDSSVINLRFNTNFGVQSDYSIDTVDTKEETKDGAINLDDKQQIEIKQKLKMKIAKNWEMELSQIKEQQQTQVENTKMDIEQDIQSAQNLQVDKPKLRTRTKARLGLLI